MLKTKKEGREGGKEGRKGDGRKEEIKGREKAKLI
jgi:hypothetical protein